MTFISLLCLLIILTGLGGFLVGLDRRITARLQGRMGPPLLQPFYDLAKLWGKESLYTNRRQVFYLYGYVLWMAVSLWLLLEGHDFLVFVFALAFSEVCLVLAGFSTRSPYSHVGSTRELLQILAAEPVLMFMAYALYLKNGTFLTVQELTASSPLLPSYPLLFLAVLLVLTIKMRKSPFDISSAAHAHQELVRGITTEFSGRYLALVEVTHWLEIVIFLFLVFMFWANPWYVGLGIALAAYLLEIVIDNVYARMNWSWMVKTSWAWGFTLSMLNILLNLTPR